uniref:Uncharacterized protein n=1 Tax=Oryza sativa subsp. japonica TaxID=39947 RepID=Q7EYJ6_ORYSJ|nr:hypothetical protein [Oryza sativa Japonica Group]BAD03826.1 hypothetical protein [Oryza sativa Japonica Group]
MARELDEHRRRTSSARWPPVVVVLAAAASMACGGTDTFPGGRWRRKRAARVDDIERALGATTLMTYEPVGSPSLLSSRYRRFVSGSRDPSSPPVCTAPPPTSHQCTGNRPSSAGQKRENGDPPSPPTPSRCPPAVRRP